MSGQLITFDQVLKHSSHVFGNKVAYSKFNLNTKQWDTISFSKLNENARELAVNFALSGIKAGDKVSLLGEASIEWIETFYALMLINAVAVPLDVKLSEQELANIFEHSESSCIFASEQFVGLARKLRHSTSRSFKLFTIGKSWERGIGTFEIQENKDALAVICYTSGTQGAPKGVMITKEALLTQMECLSELETQDDQVNFSILPLNHIYGLTGGPLSSLRRGFELCLPHQLLPDELRKCLKDRRVNNFYTVPLYLRMVMHEIFNKVRAKGKVKFAVFNVLLFVMRFMPSRSIKKKLFKDIHAYFENNLNKFVSGGAALPLTVYNFYKAIGLDIYEGYGLTETGPVIAVNTYENAKAGTVGKTLREVQVKIADDGEILTKSVCVFTGYWKNEELYQESFTSDGWFKTGDYGEYKSGYLTVVGRKKSLIVLPSGKKIHPEEVEGFLSDSPYVRLCCVLGVDEKIIAVVQPPEALVKKYQGQEKELTNLMTEEFEKMCTNLTDYKRPHEFKIMLEGIPLTPSLKIKREVLKQMLEKEYALSHQSLSSRNVKNKSFAYV